MKGQILYAPQDGNSYIKLITKEQAVWLFERKTAEWFNVTTDNVYLQRKNIYEDGELPRVATTEKSSAVHRR